MMIKKDAQAFTLIEMSIVIVIIGLIIGSVLVGKDLIASAEVRSTIAQIQKYQSAVDAFREKFGALPGDMNATTAAQFGFSTHGVAPRGQGDGNGILEGFAGCCGAFGITEGAGETLMFWQDLTYANGQNINFIEGTFNANYNTIRWNPPTPGGADLSGTNLNLYFPQAKLGRGNYVYVYSFAWYDQSWTGQNTGDNYFGISAVSKVTTTGYGAMFSSPGMTVRQAYDMDKKMDDGFPMTGDVVALYLDSNSANPLPAWAAAPSGGTYHVGNSSPGGAGPTVSAPPGPTTAATPYQTYNCYDNNNVTGPELYSMAQNANSTNCALSFIFK